MAHLAAQEEMHQKGDGKKLTISRPYHFLNSQMKPGQ